MPPTGKQKQRLKALGAKVRAIRRDKELTIKELAVLVGKEPQSIQRLEMGGVNPSFLYLLEVCKGLDIEFAELLEGFRS